MFGYSNSLSTHLNYRPEELREAAARHAAARAARSEARHAARAAAEAAALQRDQAAMFSWETHRVKSRVGLPHFLGRSR